MVLFKNKEIKGCTLGEKIKSVRVKAGISLSELAKDTKIKREYLEMLECGDYEKMPPSVYVKGFLRSYAKQLGIDQDDVLALYKKEIEINRNIKKSIKKGQSFRPLKMSLVVTPKIFLFFFFILIFCFFSLYFYRELGRFSELPRLVINYPAEGSQINDNSVYISGVTDSGNRISINGQILESDSKGNFKELLTLSNGLNEFVIKVENRFGNEIIRKLNLRAEYENVFVQEQVVKVEKQEELSFFEEKNFLKISILDVDTWISVDVNENNVYSGIIKAGDFHIFELDRSCKIDSGKGSQTFLSWNGIDLGLLSDFDDPVNDFVLSEEFLRKKLKDIDFDLGKKEILELEGSSDADTFLEQNNFDKSSEKLN